MTALALVCTVVSLLTPSLAWGQAKLPTTIQTPSFQYPTSHNTKRPTLLASHAPTHQTPRLTYNTSQNLDQAVTTTQTSYNVQETRLNTQLEDEGMYMRSQEDISSELQKDQWYSPISLNALFISEMHRNDEYRFDGMENIFILMSSYYLSSKAGLGLSLSGEYTNIRGRPSQTNASNLEGSFRIRDILTQEKHGFDLDAKWELSYTLHDQSRLKYGSYAENSFRLYPGLQINDWLSLRSSLRYYYYHLNNYRDGYSWRFRRRADVGARMRLTRNLQASVSSEYSYIVKQNRQRNEEYVDVEPRIRYHIGGGTSVSFTAGFRLLKSFDDETFSTDAYRRANYSVALFTPLL